MTRTKQEDQEQPEDDGSPKKTSRSGKSKSKDVYVAGRPLRQGDRVLQIGEVVEGAADWPRLEGWIRSGWIKKKDDDNEKEDES